MDETPEDTAAEAEPQDGPTSDQITLEPGPGHLTSGDRPAGQGVDPSGDPSVSGDLGSGADPDTEPPVA